MYVSEDEYESDQETNDGSVDDASSITGTLESYATIGSTLEELRSKSLDELIKQYAVEQYFAQKLINTKAILREKLLEEYNSLESLQANGEQIKSMMKLGLRPTWENEEPLYKDLKKIRKNISKEDFAKKQELKKIRDNLEKQVKRFFNTLLDDVYGAAVVKTPPQKAVSHNIIANLPSTKQAPSTAGIVNYYEKLDASKVEQPYNPNFEVHQIGIPARMVITAPSGSGILKLILCL